MCGIAGIVDFRSPIEPDLLPRMLAAIRHRGPDGQGTAEGRDHHIGMRRLSIIDCSGGNQPIYNEDRSVFVVLNGEIYNYLELRRELVGRGHRFTTQSDTEVLVHLYEERGIDCLRDLNGMFAFAIADLGRRTFHLVRDRLGVKPLYVHEARGRFTFSSELRSILRGGIDPGDLSSEALANYFTYLCVPSPATPFRNVRKLRAGHRVEVTSGGAKEIQWWDAADYAQAREPGTRRSAEQLEELLRDAVRLQLRSDVPVGSCLSGGVDSSLLTVLAAELHPDRLDTFFAAIEPAEFDESPYSRLVAERCGARHHEVTISVDEAVRELPKLAWMLDEPIADAAALPTFLISRLAAERVKVALSGLGGDELFGGYARYRQKVGRVARLARLPRPIVHGLLRPLLEAAGRSAELDWCLANPEPWQAYFRLLRQTPPPVLERLFPGGGFEEVVGRAAKEHFERVPGASEANRRMFVDSQLYMNDQLLQMTDRMSMACSLEMRVPMLDHRVVEFSLGLPADAKLDRTVSKKILRRAFGAILPREVFDRPKAGFGPPHERWVASGAFAALREGAAHGALAEAGFFDRGVLEEFLLRPGSSSGHGAFVWMLVVLEYWYRGLKEDPAQLEYLERTA